MIFNRYNLKALVILNNYLSAFIRSGEVKVIFELIYISIADIFELEYDVEAKNKPLITIKNQHFFEDRKISDKDLKALQKKIILISELLFKFQKIIHKYTKQT